MLLVLPPIRQYRLIKQNLNSSRKCITKSGRRLLLYSVNMDSERAKKSLEIKMELILRCRAVYTVNDVRLCQVAINILTNAVKYTHKGSVTLKISGKEIDADTFELQVKVSDKSIGIREEDLDKLFISFRRINVENNRNIEDKGFGIAIVQKIFSLVNSKLEVAGVYGEGSAFFFVLQPKIIDKTSFGDYSTPHTKKLITETTKII